MPKSRILVIDDEAAIRDSLRMTLEYEGYEFIGAATGQEGLALAEREAPDLVLLDIKMPGMDGLEVLDRLRAMNETLPVVDGLRPRHDQHRGRGDQEGRVRLPREAVREHRRLLVTSATRSSSGGCATRTARSRRRSKSGIR